MNKIDQLFDYIDDLLLDGKFKECDNFISSLTIENLSTEEVLVILTATIAAKNKLLKRQQFYKIAEKKLVKENINKSVLKGLD